MKNKKLLAKKCEGYLLEPLFDKYVSQWQSHHITNPAAIRFSFDDRVYLGLKAKGLDCGICQEPFIELDMKKQNLIDSIMDIV